MNKLIDKHFVFPHTFSNLINPLEAPVALLVLF
nr:MAG TPA: hypothetical protein [Caudoviricetes sp.]